MSCYESALGKGEFEGGNPSSLLSMPVASCVATDTALRAAIRSLLA